jgi:hypothetical protein
LDSGADGTSLTKQAADQVPSPLEEDKGQVTTYVYGNGETLKAIGQKRVGSYVVDVMPRKASTSLISVSQIVDEGHTIEFSKDKAKIKDDEGRYSISYPRGPSLAWRIPIRALELLTKLKQRRLNSRSARLRKIPLSTREKVIDLHQKMAHASEDTMCRAIGGVTPLWTNTDINVEDIGKVFSKEPCLPCVLCKRRADGTTRWKETNRNRVGERTWDLDVDQTSKEVKYEGRPDRPQDRDWQPGECISVDNVGPVNPERIPLLLYIQGRQ